MIISKKFNILSYNRPEINNQNDLDIFELSMTLLGFLVLNNESIDYKEFIKRCKEYSGHIKIEIFEGILKKYSLI